MTEIIQRCKEGEMFAELCAEYGAEEDPDFAGLAKKPTPAAPDAPAQQPAPAVPPAVPPAASLVSQVPAFSKMPPAARR